jgi:hypothetical protein
MLVNSRCKIVKLWKRSITEIISRFEVSSKVDIQIIREYQPGYCFWIKYLNYLKQYSVKGIK